MALTTIKKIIAAEISNHSPYFSKCIQVCPRVEDEGNLFFFIKNQYKKVINNINEMQNYTANGEDTLFILNSTFNFNFDIQGLLNNIKNQLNRTCRLTIVAYNPYLRFLYSLASLLGLRKGAVPTTFLTKIDLTNLCSLSGFEIVKSIPVAFLPLPIIGIYLDKILRNIPLLNLFSIAQVLILRPIIPEKELPSLSIIIPARNEKGNIESALIRLEGFAKHTPIEVIFVEGHSNDGTWEEIARVVPLYANKFKKIQSFQQSGKGKNDAVRLGFTNASCELLTILDADLTMPPELLPRFYSSYCKGNADFINGNRLLYPMEGEAMRFLNHLGNIFFAKALSFVLNVRIGDSLCGTKLVSAKDYKRFCSWRTKFGDFDPFGDFELIFPASVLCLGIIDIPIRYKARTYGETNISRFRHGLILLKMTLIGFFKIKLA
tara:strand:+ start:1136 stop:2437 length:1302 start_codon:yes stop_codon:yes gene_type:complete